MATLVFDPNNKFDPENDPDKPKIGDASPDGNGKITKVQTVAGAKALYDQFMKAPEPDLEGNREIFVVDNPTRPFVKYLVWVK